MLISMRLGEKMKKVKLVLTMLHSLFPNHSTELNFVQDYELLFAVILSAQTTDVQVNKVTAKLFLTYPTLSSYATANLSQLTQDLASINYYKNKAKYLHLTAQKLIREHKGQVPRTLEILQTLPGVGRKTANVVQRELWGKVEGIAVDTHVIRLTNQLGLVSSKDPVIIEKLLMKITPQDEWKNISLLLILYGRYYWKARQIDHGILSQQLIKNGFTAA